ASRSVSIVCPPWPPQRQPAPSPTSKDREAGRLPTLRIETGAEQSRRVRSVLHTASRTLVIPYYQMSTEGGQNRACSDRRRLGPEDVLSQPHGGKAGRPLAVVPAALGPDQQNGQVEARGVAVEVRARRPVQ